jgi:glycosyltransferase involved in cell wall biosynthesis
MTTHPIRVLAIYRGKSSENRGTPIRVRTTLALISEDPRFSVTAATWDDAPPIAVSHLHLTNRKIKDLKTLTHAARSADVVLGYTMSSWYYLAYLKLFLGKPIVLDMHGFLEEESRLYGDSGPIRYYASKLVYGLFYRLLDGITTCGGLGTDILKRHNPHVTSMIGGVNTALFNPSVSKDGFVKRKEGDVVVGYAGNARKWQGLPFLAKAFAELYAEDPSFRLALLSSEEKGLTDGSGIQVIPAMPYASVPGFLAECDILVIPREYDRVSRLGPPSKLLEYMAMGKAVVVSRVGYMDSIVTDGLNGRTYEAGSISGFKAVMRELKDSSMRERLGREAVDTVREKYGWDQEIEKLKAYLLNVTGRS